MKCEVSKSKLTSQATRLLRSSTAKAKPLFLHAAPKKHVYRVGSQEIQPKAGFTLNTRFYQVQQIHDSDESVEVLRRTQEIERLVARSLRAAVNLEELGPIALNVDCDILNADGGTRCASITAANLALRLGVRRLIAAGVCLPKNMRPTEEQRRSGWSPPALSEEEQMAHEMRVMEHDVAAISVGLIDGKSYLDLDYNLDSNADVDMNVVKVSNGAFVEVQGTGEESTYQRQELDALLDMADIGFEALFEMQKTILHGQQ